MMRLVTAWILPCVVLSLCAVPSLAFVDWVTAISNKPAAEAAAPGAILAPPSWHDSQLRPRVYRHFNSLQTPLWAKKKKGASSSGGGGSKKLQVKLLQHIAGTGQAGDVVMVTPAFFQNKLQSQKAAVVISDEQVAKEQAERDQQASKSHAIATALQEDLQQTTLTIRRKAGPDGHLFGGVGPKTILQELMEKTTSDEKQNFLGQKHVKITDVTTPDGKKMRSDIKNLGEYGAKIKLAKDVTGKVVIHVVQD